MNKNDYKILEVLSRTGSVTPFRSLTLVSLAEKTEYSIPKLRLAIKLLKALNYIEEGDCNGQKKTYFLTEAGINIIKENMNR